ncbi:pyridoxamine 5'-phosphate oxidase family protein [Gemmatimonadota bacterium]
MSKSERDPSTLSGNTNLLETAETGHLAMCRDDEPYMVPISFVWNEGRIFFHGSTSGKKMDFISANPRVCFVVQDSELVPGPDPCKLHFSYRSTLAYGFARIVDDIDEQVEALRLLAEKYSPGSGHLMNRQRVESYDDLAIIEMKVDEITSREEPSQ